MGTFRKKLGNCERKTINPINKEKQFFHLNNLNFFIVEA